MQTDLYKKIEKVLYKISTDTIKRNSKRERTHDKESVEELNKEYGDIKLIVGLDIVCTENNEAGKNNYKNDILNTFLSKLEKIYNKSISYEKYVEKKSVIIVSCSCGVILNKNIIVTLEDTTACSVCGITYEELEEHNEKVNHKKNIGKSKDPVKHFKKVYEYVMGNVKTPSRYLKQIENVREQLIRKKIYRGEMSIKIMRDTMKELNYNRLYNMAPFFIRSILKIPSMALPNDIYLSLESNFVDILSIYGSMSSYSDKINLCSHYYILYKILENLIIDENPVLLKRIAFFISSQKIATIKKNDCVWKNICTHVKWLTFRPTKYTLYTYSQVY